MHLAAARDDHLVDVGGGAPDMGVRGAVIALLVATQTAAPAALAAHVAGGQADVEQAADGTIVVVAPDDALLIAGDAFAAAAVFLGLGDPFGSLDDLRFGQAGGGGAVGQAHLAGGAGRLERPEGGRIGTVSRHRHISLEGGLGDEVGIDPALIGDIGEQRVVQCHV